MEILDRVATEVTSEAARHAKSEWAKLTDKYDIEEVRVDPIVTLIANDNWLEYNLRYVTMFNKRRMTKNELFTKLMDEFDNVPEKFGIASSTYDIVAFPPVSVNMSRDDD